MRSASSLPSVRDVAPPVVVEQHGVEAGLAQGQRELEIAVAHRAERHDARCIAQRELGEPAEGDVDGIEPEDVVGPLAAANEAELRAHDAGQDVHAPARRGERLALARGGACQLRELGVQLLAEIFDQSLVRRAATPAAQRASPRRAPAGRTA